MSRIDFQFARPVNAVVVEDIAAFGLLYGPQPAPMTARDDRQPGAALHTSAIEVHAITPREDVPMLGQSR
ncbi:hypothetical protein [Burkholderia multivorans]|uniref:hypothetical protein n=1 Tax=Burkholderia multivorans TaxID=87883 RepID=UPI0011B20B1A|nr:hypothetical protein [Burkholderia multivorans]MBU9619652.1 hypothetical protein [Burkholderia multivorans]NGM78202.1 hypothetical protein [Burkholderia multivorans]